MSVNKYCVVKRLLKPRYVTIDGIHLLEISCSSFSLYFKCHLKLFCILWNMFILLCVLQSSSQNCDIYFFSSFYSFCHRHVIFHFKKLFLSHFSIISVKQKHNRFFVIFADTFCLVLYFAGVGLWSGLQESSFLMNFLSILCYWGDWIAERKWCFHVNLLDFLPILVVWSIKPNAWEKGGGMENFRIDGFGFKFINLFIFFIQIYGLQ